MPEKDALGNKLVQYKDVKPSEVKTSNTSKDIDNASEAKNFSLPKIDASVPSSTSARVILIGGIVIISIGAINAAINKRPETPVFAGGIGFILLASLLDAIGGGLSRIAVGLTGLAVVTVVLVEGPSLFQAITNSKGVAPDVLGPPVSITGNNQGSTSSTQGTTVVPKSTGGGGALHM